MVLRIKPGGIIKKKYFKKIVEDAFIAIPEKFRRLLSNVQIVVEDEASQVQRQKVHASPGSLIFGLYEGVPQTKRGMGYGGVLPDKITIFQKPIEQVAGGDEEKIRKIVNDAVYHEIAHHFGTNEERIRQIEIRRKK